MHAPVTAPSWLTENQHHTWAGLRAVNTALKLSVIYYSATGNIHAMPGGSPLRPKR
jgi:hypothetical protein